MKKWLGKIGNVFITTVFGVAVLTLLGMVSEVVYYAIALLIKDPFSFFMWSCLIGIMCLVAWFIGNWLENF